MRSRDVLRRWAALLGKDTPGGAARVAAAERFTHRVLLGEPHAVNLEALAHLAWGLQGVRCRNASLYDALLERCDERLRADRRQLAHAARVVWACAAARCMATAPYTSIAEQGLRIAAATGRKESAWRALDAPGEASDAVVAYGAPCAAMLEALVVVGHRTTPLVVALAEGAMRCWAQERARTAEASMNALRVLRALGKERRRCVAAGDDGGNALKAAGGGGVLNLRGVQYAVELVEACTAARPWQIKAMPPDQVLHMLQALHALPCASEGQMRRRRDVLLPALLKQLLSGRDEGTAGFETLDAAGGARASLPLLHAAAVGRDCNAVSAAAFLTVAVSFAKRVLTYYRWRAEGSGDAPIPDAHLAAALGDVLTAVHMLDGGLRAKDGTLAWAVKEVQRRVGGDAGPAWVYPAAALLVCSSMWRYRETEAAMRGHIEVVGMHGLAAALAAGGAPAAAGTYVAVRAARCLGGVREHEAAGEVLVGVFEQLNREGWGDVGLEDVAAGVGTATDLCKPHLKLLERGADAGGCQRLLTALGGAWMAASGAAMVDPARGFLRCRDAARLLRGAAELHAVLRLPTPQVAPYTRLVDATVVLHRKSPEFAPSPSELKVLVSAAAALRHSGSGVGAVVDDADPASPWLRNMSMEKLHAVVVGFCRMRDVARAGALLTMDALTKKYLPTPLQAAELLRAASVAWRERPRQDATTTTPRDAAHPLHAIFFLPASCTRRLLAPLATESPEVLRMILDAHARAAVAAPAPLLDAAADALIGRRFPPDHVRRFLDTLARLGLGTHPAVHYLSSVVRSPRGGAAKS